MDAWQHCCKIGRGISLTYWFVKDGIKSQQIKATPYGMALVYEFHPATPSRFSRRVPGATKSDIIVTIGQVGRAIGHTHYHCWERIAPATSHAPNAA